MISRWQPVTEEGAVTTRAVNRVVVAVRIVLLLSSYE